MKFFKWNIMVYAHLVVGPVTTAVRPVETEQIPLNIAEKIDAMRQCTRQYAMIGPGLLSNFIERNNKTFNYHYPNYHIKIL